MPHEEGVSFPIQEERFCSPTSQNNSSIFHCHVCETSLHPRKMTCGNCVNAGRFGPLKHAYSFESMFHASVELPAISNFADGLQLRKKLNEEKQLYLSEVTQQLTLFTAIRLLSTQIERRKASLPLIRQSLTTLRQEIERKRGLNATLEHRIRLHRSQIADIRRDNACCAEDVAAAKKVLHQKRNKLIKKVKRMSLLRKEQIHTLSHYIFPIVHISVIEEDLASRIRALTSAQREIHMGIDDGQRKSDAVLLVEYDRYQIVQSCLQSNGKYEISKLLAMANLEAFDTPDSESPQSLVNRELREVLSALSHACQLINTLSFVFQVHLPFRLHHCHFNQDCYQADDLHMNIARLNTNIITVCLSQGISIDDDNVTHTLANIHKLFASQQYPHQSVPVEYSKKRLAVIAGKTIDTNELCLVYPESDDDENEVEILNPEEWEKIPCKIDIPDDSSMDGRTGLFSAAAADPPSIRTSAMGYLNRGFGLFVSALNPFKS